MRDANCRCTLEIYSRARIQAKRDALHRVVEMIFPQERLGYWHRGPRPSCWLSRKCLGDTGIFAGIWYAFGTLGRWAASKTMAGCGRRLSPRTKCSLSNPYLTVQCI